MSNCDDAGSVTLIFYKVGERWWKEPALNLIAAAAQMSLFTHVEVAIGNDHGHNGEMSNVCRIFNDDVPAGAGTFQTHINCELTLL